MHGSSPCPVKGSQLPVLTSTLHISVSAELQSSSDQVDRDSLFSYTDFTHSTSTLRDLSPLPSFPSCMLFSLGNNGRYITS